MPKTQQFKALFLAPFFLTAALVADEVEDVSPLVEVESEEVEETAPAPSETDVGTKSFDAESVNELFKEYEAENKRRAEEFSHMNSDHLEVIELGPINAQAYEVRNLDLLIDKLDPQPRRRLQRLAELDPVAAANIQVTARSEERFFGGENDYGTDMNAGSTANVDFRKAGKAITSAFEKAKAAMREKKATDDQAPLPTE
ncbi:hypothetical protein [Pelagicoccus mobilis]|uniref:Uncharacterized protein n=1 Tax=Pelagicoccus mobilis TaxID=415221 RepID=A0A934VUP1_9BACT|nr:hypothetical protein [Pelagicoccus mobilis]MBK1880714.1 hypothetical protein [Pelagicoccus mobilis]